METVHFMKITNGHSSILGQPAEIWDNVCGMKIQRIQHYETKGSLKNE